MKTIEAPLPGPELNIYEYQNPRQFLLDQLSVFQKRDSKFSARSWAKKMGLPAPSLLIMILQGTRPLLLKHVDFLNRGLNLSTPEQLFFRALIQLTNAKTIEEKRLCEFWISELNPGSSLRIKEISEHEVISKWIHFTILSMTHLKAFDGKVDTIHKLLESKVSVHEVRSALMRLEELGLVTRDEKSGRLLSTNTAVSTRDDVTIKASHEYFKSVFRMAEDAVSTQSVLEREFQALAIAVPHDRITLAKEMIRRFRSQFIQAMVPDNATADHVYQLNLQFFRLTECPSEQWRALENEGATSNRHTQSKNALAFSTAKKQNEGNV